VIQRYTGIFRADSFTKNVEDSTSVVGAGPAYGANRSGGASLIDTVQLPGISQQWSLQSISFITSIAMVVTCAVYGRLGKLMAGLMRATDPNVQSGPPTGLIWVSPHLPLPADTSLTVALFDPAVNECPPIINAGTAPGAPTAQTAISSFLALQGILQLPQMVPFVPAEQIMVGLWWLPTIIGYTQGGPQTWRMAAYRTRYTVLYDDGLG